MLVQRTGAIICRCVTFFGIVFKKDSVTSSLAKMDRASLRQSVSHQTQQPQLQHYRRITLTIVTYVIDS